MLFVGAGIAKHMATPEGVLAPNGAALAQELASHFSIDTTSTNLSKVAQVVEGRKGRQALEEFLRKRLANLQPDQHLRWLYARRWQAIFTTNYDSCIERAYELNLKPLQNPVPISSTSDVTNFDQRLDVPIYHLHGSLFGSRGGIVITETDYSKFRDRRRMLFDILKYKFATAPILYIGYSHQDQNWKLVWDELTEEFLPSVPPLSYRVSPDTDALDVEILEKKGVVSVDSNFEGFAIVASVEVDESEADPERFAKIRSMVPSHLLGTFEKSPAATIRLLSSWTYVNQAVFSEKPNIDKFLWGDRPNWGLIAAKHYFERDVEEDIYDEVLDYVTSAPTGPAVALALGPAGYGITTLLMSTAVRLLDDGVNPIFAHKPGTPITEGDVHFATTQFAQPPIFFIDDATDNASGLQEAVTLLRSDKKPALFVLGSRLNEWRQRRARIGGKEFIVDVLSDAEINRLLDLLARHHALNKLESLTRDFQFAVIKEKHDKQLLVAMREATEGKGFDAILEDEFRGIKGAFSKSTYLAVSCFYQHGAYIRDAVLAKILGVQLPDLYEMTKDELDGVVIYDCIDEASGTYAARTRHRSIAAVIWQRCGGKSEQEKLLQSGISNLNLNYASDIRAFEYLIRSDHLIDGIRSLDDKIKFFETACKKDPESPYVRQHYARMLSRESKPDLALNQIDEGFKIREKSPPRVLFHTKGIILTQLAVETESENIARRRLVQAEEVFRKAITINPRDQYSYQGLASLYLAWAKRASTDVESAEYVSKAESVISEGLTKVRERDSLWIATAEIEKWLGDTPRSLKALEAAVVTTPGSIIARYLLGRAYRQMGSPDKTLTILEPVIKGHADEFRAFVEYALALLDIGKPLKEAIAILNISTTYGLGDARYIATLGGLLFLSNDFDAAHKVFQESIRREFSYIESSTIQFRPKHPGDNTPFSLLGKIVKTAPKFTVIEAEGYPTFRCNWTKAGGVPLRFGMPVQFAVEFAARGPSAFRPALL